MVTRVTNQSMQANALRNIFRITEELFNAQRQISTGKRVTRLADDPSAVRDSVVLHSDINETRQYGRNIDFNKLFVEATDSALDSAGNHLIRARELATAQVGAPSTAETRRYVRDEVSNILASVLQDANTTVKGQYVFGGSLTRSAPFAWRSTTEMDYAGNTQTQNLEIAPGVTVNLNLPGSDVFMADLNPVLSGSRQMSELNAGSGIPAGSFKVVDRAGASGTVTVTSTMTVTGLISAINSAGTSVRASINSAQNGITLTDNSTVISGALTVSEVGSGTAAASLGILGSFDGNITGGDLNPVLTSTTPLSELNGGKGLTLTAVQIVNGSASGTVSLSTAATVGDVLNLINASGLNVTAAINGRGNALRVTSNSSSTVAIVMESGTGTSARDLGIGGGGIFSTLINLREALDKNDQPALIALLKNLEGSLSSTNNGRSSIGAVSRRLVITKDVHDKGVEDLKSNLSSIEDADLVESASNLAQMQNALQATLNSTAKIIQPTLMDFLS